MDNEVIRLFIDWLARIALLASASLWLIHWASRVIIIWLPKRNWPNFWIFFERLKETLFVLSAPPPKDSSGGNGTPRT
jgi:hypothetical protein